MSTRTPNAGLYKPYFNQLTWHDQVNWNFDTIDALLNGYIGIKNVQGVWQNSTEYTVGQVVVDQQSGFLYQVLVDHTSATSPTTFAQDRLDNPTYWSLKTTFASYKGAWVTAADYTVGDFIVNDDEQVYAVCNTDHTSGVWDDDLTKWDVLIDAGQLWADMQQALADAQTAQAAAEVAADEAEYWATQHRFGDADLDTYVEFELTADDDTIRFVAGGTDVFDVSSTETDWKLKPFRSYAEKVTTATVTGGTYTLDLTLGNVWSINLNGDATFAFSNVPAAGLAASVTLIIVSTSTAYTITWPGSVNWNDDTVPVLDPVNTAIITLITVDGGTTWYGMTPGVLF